MEHEDSTWSAVAESGHFSYTVWSFSLYSGHKRLSATCEFGEFLEPLTVCGLHSDVHTVLTSVRNV